MDRYIGMDVHAMSCTVCIVGPSGRQLKSDVVETNGQALVEYLRNIPRPRHLCFEEGTQSAWLHEILSPHVDELVVVGVTRSRGAKSDAKDALGLAQALRLGAIDTTVFKAPSRFARLRALATSYDQITRDVTRTQTRIKALFRARGIPALGQMVYSPAQRPQWLEKLPQECRASAELLWQELDAQRELKRAAEKQLIAESHRHHDQYDLGDMPWLRPDSGRVVDSGGSNAEPIPHVTTALVVLGPRNRDALLSGLGEEKRRLGANRNGQDSRAQSLFQSDAQVRVQGRSNDGDHQAAGLAAAATLHEAAGGRHEAQSRQAHARPNDRGDLSQHVEARGDLRSSTASSSIINVRQSEVRHDRKRTAAVSYLFGEHGSKVSIHELPGPACAVEVPSLSYAPSEFRTKQWLSEAQIEGWFPPFDGERNCFDAKPINRLSATTVSQHWRPDSAVADDSDLTCTHSPNCYVNAGNQDHDLRRSGEPRL